MKRRSLLKGLGLLPFGGTFLGTTLSSDLSNATPVKKMPQGESVDLMKELGIRTFINAAGTYTTMTASLMQPEVIDAISRTSKRFCMLNDVQDKVGEKIAEIVHAEAAMVTAGAFSALTLGMAGILTGKDVRKIQQIPQDLEANGMRSEVLLQKTHYEGYEKALYNTGVKIIPVETAEDVERLVSDKTAAMHFLNCNASLGKIQHQEWLSLARKYKVPATIDIAADIPPVSNLWKYNDMGFDFVTLSGGKILRGPQSTGLLMGRRGIIEAAKLNNSPNSVTIGRGMKVNKEEMFGMYVALKKYVGEDREKEWKDWEHRVNTIYNAIKDLRGVNASIFHGPINMNTPMIHVFWDKSQITDNREEFLQRLRDGEPSIEVLGNNIGLGFNDDGFNMTTYMMQPGEEKIVAKRLREEFINAAKA